MKTIIAFSTVKDIFEILGWEYPSEGSYRMDPEAEKLYDSLWENGFNLDDWDGGFACKEPLCRWTNSRDEECEEPDGCGNFSDCDDGVYPVWDPAVEWLGSQMENYCVGYNHCYFQGYHWYTVHHS